MNKKRIVALSLFVMLITVTISLAQDKVTLEVMYLPNRQYKIVTSSTTSTGVFYLKADSISEPLTQKHKVEGRSTMHMTVITEDPDSTGTFIVRTRVDSSSNVAIVEGVQQEPSNKSSAIDGLKTVGRATPTGKYYVDSIMGTNITPEMAESMKVFIADMVSKIKYPNDPLTIGSEFDQSFPREVPLPGGTPLLLSISMHYVLTDIKGDLVFCDINPKISMSLDTNNANLDFNAEGNGSAIFSIDNKYLIDYKTSMILNIETKTDLTFSMTVQMESHQTTEITLRN